VTGTHVLLVTGLSTLVVLVAYWAKALSRSGAVAAWWVGTLVFGCGGFVWMGVLLAFFVSSSALSRLWAARKADVVAAFAKGGRRDWGQVLANGGIAAALAVAVCVLGKANALYPLLAFAYYGSLAAATADTWATEVGVLDPSPRRITDGTVVAPGTSGGVSTSGIAASLAGGAFIGITVFTLVQMAARITLGHFLWQEWVVIPATALAGLLGSLADSLVGATVQAVYWCPTCAKETERAVHRCGTRTTYHRGWRWCSNDVVNFVGAFVGGIIAALVAIAATY